MSDTQRIWEIVWTRAAQGPNPFEVSEIAPEVARALEIPPDEAAERTLRFVRELERAPEGEQFFRAEGDAVVPLPEFERAAKDPATARQLYPFEV